MQNTTSCMIPLYAISRKGKIHEISGFLGAGMEARITGKQA